ncbi:unnamed protein product [Soboliphyme baturini]|uniref:Ovule protein n=1 Tax=Soboliphyme baturini TaxID=241478 RepID=A0A183JBD0_9BILA|nr:unnamed protein product [Soboliphyme baturini]
MQRNLCKKYGAAVCKILVLKLLLGLKIQTKTVMSDITVAEKGLMKWQYQKTSESKIRKLKKLRDKDLLFEVQRLWKKKAAVVLKVIGDVGTKPRGLERHVKGTNIIID